MKVKISYSNYQGGRLFEKTITIRGKDLNDSEIRGRLAEWGKAHKKQVHTYVPVEETEEE